jgi:hypothetical protein
MAELLIQARPFAFLPIEYQNSLASFTYGQNSRSTLKTAGRIWEQRSDQFLALSRGKRAGLYTAGWQAHRQRRVWRKL